MALSNGRVWCVGGFDGQQTLGETLCIDVQQLGQLKASSHSTEPQTFTHAEEDSVASIPKGESISRKEDGKLESAEGELERLTVRALPAHKLQVHER